MAQTPVQEIVRKNRKCKFKLERTRRAAISLYVFAYLTIFSLVTTLIFDLLTLKKSNQFIFVPSTPKL